MEAIYVTIHFYDLIKEQLWFITITFKSNNPITYVTYTIDLLFPYQ